MPDWSTRPWAAVKKSFDFIKEVACQFSEDECTNMAATLAFYAMFSLAPLLVIVIRLVGLVVGPDAVRTFLQTQVDYYMGKQAAEQVLLMAHNAYKPGAGTLPMVLSGVAILFGATGVLVQLQSALNKAWEVEPRATGVKGILIKRLLSLGMILGIAALLLLMLVLSTMVTAVGDLLGSHVPTGVSYMLVPTLHVGLSFVLAMFLFAALYALLPDTHVAWRDVWMGAAVTSILFVVGNLLLGLFFRYGSAGSVYGAAGSLAVVLLWVYYSSMIVLLGAELSHVILRRKRKGAAAAEE